MRALHFTSSIIRKMRTRLMLLVFLLAAGVLPFFSREHVKYETIEATAMGTGTQLGASAGVSLEIYEFSTPEDRQVLVQAFEKGQNQGLVNALSRMRAVGIARSRARWAMTWLISA